MAHESNGPVDAGVGAGAVSRLLAQGLTGQVAGSVVDSSGSVMPGVTVKVVNAGTQTMREVVTDAEGVVPHHGAARRHLRPRADAARDSSPTRSAAIVRLGQRARRAAADRARGRPAHRERVGHRGSGPRADAERRAVRPHHAGAAQGRRAQGPRLHGHAEAAARASSTRRTARPPAGTTSAASASTAGATTPST